MLARDVAIAVCLMAATAASSLGAGDEIVGANDVDQIEEGASKAPDVHRRDPDRDGLRLRGRQFWRGQQRHGARGDAEEPVREGRDAGVEAYVGDGNVDGDRAERAGLE